MHLQLLTWTMGFFWLLYFALHRSPAEPGPHPRGAIPAVARGRHNPQWLLLAGSLCKKVRPRGKQTRTPIHLCQSTQQTRLSGTHLPQKAFGGEVSQCLVGAEARHPCVKLRGPHGHVHRYFHTHQPSCSSENKQTNKQKTTP